VFYVEPDGVLFTGDLAMRAQPGLNQRSTVAHWLESLDRLEALHPSRIVPSHGPMGDVSFVANYRTYLQTIRTRVAALKRDGRNIEETAQTVATELLPQYPDRNRTMAAARIVYNQQ
jgi:glyoxylase-like metal-dependent hydrolase (beta-lactamase superfamily II)